MRTRDSLERREIEKYSSNAVPTLCLCCIAQFRYFNNNWMVYQLQNFLDELFKLPSNSSNPLPQKWPLISLSLSSFQIFQKYFFVLKPLLKPFQTNTQITFHRFSFPFTFLQFFFFEIIPTYRQITIVPPQFSPLFSQRYSTPFPTSSNFLKPQISFLE